jgi:hypothetical protein
VYSGALNAELFITLLEQMMKGRRRALYLVLDGLPAHKTKAVREYVEQLKGKLADRVQAQLADIAAKPDLVRSFFGHPNVAYISDL